MLPLRFPVVTPIDRIGGGREPVARRGIQFVIAHQCYANAVSDATRRAGGVAE